MSLGYARDSIADLQSLHSVEKEEPDTNTAPSSYYLRGKTLTEQVADDDDYYNFEEDALFMEEQEDPTQEFKSPVPLNVPLQLCNNKTKETINDVMVHLSNPSVTAEAAVATATASTSTTTTTTTTTNILLEETTEHLNDDDPLAVTCTFASTHNRSGSSNSVVKERSKNQTVNYAYSGFDYSDYYQDSYMNEFGTRSSKKNTNILCCLFPFLQDPLLSDDEDEEDEEGRRTTQDIDRNNEMEYIPSSDEKKTFNSFNVLGDNDALGSIRDAVGIIEESMREQLSLSPSPSTSDTDLSYSTTGDHCECQSQAPPVMRVGPISPSYSLETDKIHCPTEKENHSITMEQPTPQIKGILKHTVIKPQMPTRSERYVSTLSSISKSPSDKNLMNIKRRSILPTYESSVVHKSLALDESSENTQSCKSVSFSSMARVVPVLPRSEMSYFLKSMIWWQRADYEDFKKAGRIISKAMLQGGSEIWLQTSDAWGKKRDNRTVKNLGSSLENEQILNSEEYRSALRKYGVNDQSEEKVIEDDINDVGHKWWCKFGHSRRGLEHIVSVDEGRQRQKLVNASITAVLEEQRRQRLTRKDPNKIAAISMQYTSWAKDLARAAGEADAEAVRSNFHSKAKGRLSYLSSSLLKRKDVEKVEGQPCASFILSANSALMAEVLDSHAHDGTASLLSTSVKERAGMLVKGNTRSESKDDIAHKAAGFQFQQAAPA
jgi:hypothetical protein